LVQRSNKIKKKVDRRGGALQLFKTRLMNN
jgi:hypothetical protein